MSYHHIWLDCLKQLQTDLPKQQFVTWIQPLTFEVTSNEQSVLLIANNRFIKEWVLTKYIDKIATFFASQGAVHLDIHVVLESEKASFQVPEQPSSTQVEASRAIKQPEFSEAATFSTSPKEEQKPISPASPIHLEEERLGIIDVQPPQQPSLLNEAATAPFENQQVSRVPLHIDQVLEQNNPHLDKSFDAAVSQPNSQQNLSTPFQEETIKLDEAEQVHSEPDRPQASQGQSTNIVSDNTFANFVEGKSNQLARAAAMQVAENPGGSYNPLFLYGGVGLGKTHLMHAVGNALAQKKANAKIVYLHSERFVADMVKALQLNAINDFKRYYRSVDALLIDDIQFFANKERSQEEFFHTFNALLEGGQQIILTCDRYPREIKGLEERLKSRFGWGLTVAVEPPELETRVAILMKKAEQSNMELSRDSAFFIAQRIRSNVRELEGALRRVMAQAQFQGRKIDIELIKDSLKDLLSLQDRLVSIDNIQKTVAEYYKIKLADLLSKRRSRSVARPRQVAMALAKELTSHSLPEIGDAFGGRDHTTVLHACRKIQELKETTSDIREDVNNLLRILTT